MAPVRRPARVLVAATGHDQPRIRAVRPAGMDVETATGASDERQAIPLRGPRRRIRVVDVVGEPANVAAVAVHDVDLRCPTAVGGERDFATGG